MGLGPRFRADEQTYAYTPKRPSESDESVLGGESHRHGAIILVLHTWLRK